MQGLGFFIMAVGLIRKELCRPRKNASKSPGGRARPRALGLERGRLSSVAKEGLQSRLQRLPLLT
jgi:hypothetical protein